MNLSIERARPEQVEDIQRMFYRTWLDTYPNAEHGITREDIDYHFKDRFSGEALERRRADVHNLGKDKIYLVALDGEEVIGACSAERSEKQNKITQFYVLPEYQGKGVGTALWEEAKKFLDPAKDTLVGVVVYNEKAIRFYQKLGFVDTGHRFTDERLRMKNGAYLPEMEMRIAAPRRE